MIFTATSGHLTSVGQVELTGNLEIYGQTRTLTLRAEVNNTGGSLKFSPEVDIDRRDWGVSYAAQVRSSTKIQVEITAYFDRA
jgi:polyisoprenoid-binding protein YceI